MATYEQKKKSCEDRMIGFNFTKEQWSELNRLKGVVSCAYSNVKFVKTKDHMHSASLERLFDDRPYSPENCVWVTKVANELKSRYIENGLPETGLTGKDYEILKRIKRILESTDNIAAIQEPYKHLFNDKTESEKPKEMTTENKASSSYDYNNTQNPELAVAKLYASFGAFVEQRCNGEFEITYAQFKSIITRKRCMLTLRELPENLFERGFWVKDKSLPVTKNNLLVTTKELQTALDNMCVSANLDITTLKLLGEALIK